MEQIFENGEFKHVLDELKEGANILHSECEESFDSADASNKNWRESARIFRESGEISSPKLDFSRFFSSEWKYAKINAKQLKLCPGENCEQWLPLYNFAANSSTDDKLDVYCMKCNARRKQNRKRKIDRYESFVQASTKSDEDKQKAVYREVERRIAHAAKEAQTRYGRKFTADHVEISRKLFQNKAYLCNVTGNTLTPECFLEHHTLTFQLSKEKCSIEIIASQCRIVPTKQSVCGS